MYKISKIWFDNNKFSLWKSLVYDYLFNFCLFYFSKFQMTIVKNLTNNHQLFIMDFKSPFEVLLRHKYFYLQVFHNETAALLKFFEIYTKMRFASLFSLNERNIATSLFVIHLKCTVVYYANLKSSSIDQPFLNQGPSNMLFFYFSLMF